MKSARTYSMLIALTVPFAVATASTSKPFGRLSVPKTSVEQVQARHAALTTFVESAAEPLTRIDRGLRAALDLLGQPLAPAATRFILDRPQPGDTAVVAAALKGAIALLAEAQASLAAIEDDDAEADAPDTWTLALDLEAAMAMADGLAAIWQVNGGTEADRDAELQEAAAGLVIVLEDERPAVVAAAKLWLAQVYLQRGLHERAVQILPDVLQSPAGESTHAFYARWLRCAQLATGPESLPAILALSARLAEQCRPWFEDGEDSDRAERTAVMLHRQLLTRWEANLNAAGSADQAAWCRGAIEKVDATFFAVSTDLLPLDTAVPPLRKLTEVTEHLARQKAKASAPPVTTPPVTTPPAASDATVDTPPPPADANPSPTVRPNEQGQAPQPADPAPAQPTDASDPPDRGSQSENAPAGDPSMGQG